jgi:hypothetical protein
MTSKQSLIVLLIVAVLTSLLVLSGPVYVQCPIPAAEFIPASRFTSAN